MITSIVKTFLISFGISCIAYFLLNSIGSNYVFGFLSNNIVNIQIGLLAINTATLGVVLTKLRDLVDRGIPLSAFAKARSEMLLSIREQLALILAALIILSLSDATLLPYGVSPVALKILLLTCFTYSITILYDTAKSVFVVLADGSES